MQKKLPRDIRVQHWLPHHLVCKFAGLMAFCKISWIKNYLIRDFMRRYGVSLVETKINSVEQFIHFNDFFTRQLKSDARPIAGGNSIASPCDGTISQIGHIAKKTLVQAKGHTYRLEKLLTNPELAYSFENGLYTTIYLSPKDYHRVHMPITGTLTQMIYVPGDLFSVNQLTAQHVPDLFARNERVICIFETAVGPMAIILVGAMIVGSIATTWAGTVPPHQPTLTTWNYTKSTDQHITLEKGEEMGLFHLGSTVIVLFSSQVKNWTHTYAAGNTVQMGQALGFTE